jgi:prevent-host-death family protein
MGLAMADTISARDAAHHFARVLAEVAAGKEFIVTRHGVPVARISPERAAEGRRELTQKQEQALADNLERLRRGWKLRIRQLDRDSLHDDARATQGTARQGNA